MRLRQVIIACSLLGAVCAPDIGAAHAAQRQESRGDREDGRAGRNQERNRWSADPDRGWVRTDESPQSEKRKPEKSKSEKRNKPR